MPDKAKLVCLPGKGDLATLMMHSLDKKGTGSQMIHDTFTLLPCQMVFLPRKEDLPV